MKQPPLHTPPPREPASPPRQSRNRWSLLLLLIPFVALLYPAFYSSIQPELAGIPYFIWYQLAWVLLGALIVGLVHILHD
jgi:hypothetical protein